MTFLAVLFSFITVIYLTNLFIGLLSNAISDYNDRVPYLVQKAKVRIKDHILNSFIVNVNINENKIG